MANAGVTAVARIGDITEDHLDTLLSTNIKGVVFTVQKALPLLNDGGSIIITGSTTAERGREGLGVSVVVSRRAGIGRGRGPCSLCRSLSRWIADGIG